MSLVRAGHVLIHPYDPALWPGSANQCIPGNANPRSSLPSHLFVRVSLIASVVQLYSDHSSTLSTHRISSQCSSIRHCNSVGTEPWLVLCWSLVCTTLCNMAAGLQPWKEYWLWWDCSSALPLAWMTRNTAGSLWNMSHSSPSCLRYNTCCCAHACWWQLFQYAMMNAAFQLSRSWMHSIDPGFCCL